MRRLWAIAAAGCLFLAFFAVWYGALNQDEGWYLYAANLVAEGRLPYRGFFYTQGPLLPLVYSPFAAIWQHFGLLGARLFTLALGLAGIGVFARLAAELVLAERRQTAAFTVFALLGLNLYHLYYVTIPKTYALAALLTAAGFLAVVLAASRRRQLLALAGGFLLVTASGARISLGVLPVVAGLWLLLSRERRRLLWGFVPGSLAAFAAVYLPFLLDPAARSGLFAAQAYHAARGGFDAIFTAGSLSRLVRWYLPLVVLLGLGWRRQRAGSGAWLPLAGFAAVFAVQMLAPFPYEDYQVPVMGLLAVYVAVALPPLEVGGCRVGALLALGLALAASLSSPLLEQWAVDGQDRFWPLKRTKTQLAQLRHTASLVERLDPGGRDLLTQDLYLAIECNRRVPAGLEMGPFSYWGAPSAARRVPAGVLDDAAMFRLLESAPCQLAAFSGYGFAITAPEGAETPMDRQLAFWEALKRHYELAFSERGFGQGATTLLVLRRREAAGESGGE